MSYNLILASSLLNWKSFLSILKNKHTSILCKNFWQNAMATLDKKSCVFVPSSIVKTGKKISFNYIRIKIWLIFFWWVNFWWCQFLTLWCFLFIAFACNAKSFAIAFIFLSYFIFFFHFIVLALFLDGQIRVFLRIFHHSLPRKRVASIGLVSLDTMANILLMICLLLDTRVTVKVACPLEKLVMTGFKWACKCHKCFW